MTVDVAIVGLGYVGLPLAQEAARRGLSIVGFDVNQAVVDGLSAGRSHVDDLADSDVAQMLAAGFEATTDPARIADADNVVICVPTPLSAEGGPDLGAVVAATKTVAGQLRKGQTIILESTTYPGTTDEVCLPLLEEASGLTAGTDFFLAFSPERVDPGNPTYGIKNTPKVVGGYNEESRDRASAFYARFVDTVVPVNGTREAELAKLLENTFRHVNIALVNEMSKFCHDLGIDLWEVIRAASTKPFGFMPFYPGPGVGGHCIPIDPNYLSFTVATRLGYPFRLVELAQEINNGQPVYVSRRIQDMLNGDAKALKGSTVLLLGVTYKADIADQRESPAVPLADVLLKNGVDLRFHDPLVTRWNISAHPDPQAPTLDVEQDLDAAIADADIVVLLQKHHSYDADAIAAKAKLFLDTRGTVTVSDKAERL